MNQIFVLLLGTFSLAVVVLAMFVLVWLIDFRHHVIGFGEEVARNLKRSISAVYHSYEAAWVRWRCERARRYLRRFDHGFRMYDAGLEAERRRRAYLLSGGRKNDAKFPGVSDVLREWGFLKAKDPESYLKLVNFEERR